MLRTWRLLVLLLLFVTGACASPGPVVKQDAQRAASSLPRQHVRAGTSGNYPPLSSWTGERPEGFAPALLQAFAAAEKIELAWTRFQWPALGSDLRDGRFEIAADGITVRPERSVSGRFSVPIARGGAVLLLRRPSWAAPARKSDGAGGMREALQALHAIDRRELRVVVNRGGHLERVARSLFAAAEIRPIADNAGAREALARGEADAAMTNTFEAPRWGEGLAGIEAIGPLTNDVTALWLRADRGDLAERLDAWLLSEEENGHLAELRGRFLGAAAGARTARPVDALLAGTSERLALMPFVAAAKKKTGKTVEDTAQEERVLAAAAETVAKAAAALGTPPPPRERVDAFFRAQIEAAKVVQQHVTEEPSAPAFSLERDLRPAIARITARMAFLIVRIPRRTERAAVVEQAREDLAGSGLDAASIDRLGTALAALGDREADGAAVR